MTQRLMRWLVISFTSSVLVGCSSTAVLQTSTESPTMLEIYHATLPRTERVVERTELPQHHSSQARVRMLHNPLIHIYVFEHFTQTDKLWVPGYWTAIQLYESDQLALSHEIETHIPPSE